MKIENLQTEPNVIKNYPVQTRRSSDAFKNADIDAEGKSPYASMQQDSKPEQDEIFDEKALMQAKQTNISTLLQSSQNISLLK